jgi:hypothetical protein
MHLLTCARGGQGDRIRPRAGTLSRLSRRDCEIQPAHTQSELLSIDWVNPITWLGDVVHAAAKLLRQPDCLHTVLVHYQSWPCRRPRLSWWVLVLTAACIAPIRACGKVLGSFQTDKVARRDKLGVFVRETPKVPICECCINLLLHLRRDSIQLLRAKTNG